MEGTSSGTHGAVSTRELAARITELCGHLNAANRRWLALIAEFDRRKGWSDSLTQSCAHWLNWQCGIALGAAPCVERAGSRLPLPGLHAHALRGRPSRPPLGRRRRLALQKAGGDSFVSAAPGRINT